MRLFPAEEEVARRHGLWGQVNGLVLDLGVSSPQLDAPERGFSFATDGPLDMRMDTSSGQTAAEWLAKAEEREIVQVLKEYGEERQAGRIARAIVRARVGQPIRTTRALREIVVASTPFPGPNRHRHRLSSGDGYSKHPATQTFQALRIRVNRELDELEACLACVCDLLSVGGRLVVISFHSLEDRIVKRFIRDQARGDRLPRTVPVTARETHAHLRALGGMVRPSAAEVAANPRARSARMRVAERLA